jgi:hypothetical protein
LREPLANPVQCEHRLLLDILDRHKAHWVGQRPRRWPRHQLHRSCWS